MGIAANTSTVECCFKKTVDAQIRAPLMPKASRHAGVWNRWIRRDAHQTAAEPITWIEGQTLVWVSNW